MSMLLRDSLKIFTRLKTKVKEVGKMGKKPFCNLLVYAHTCRPPRAKLDHAC